MTVTLYGIPNCDTVKKARKFLEAEGVDYQFHDYKKQGVDAALLKSWCEQLGVEVLLNTRGTTWRKLSDTDKAKAQSDVDQAVQLMVANSSMIKRPVLVRGDTVLVGFDAKQYLGLKAA